MISQAAVKYIVALLLFGANGIVASQIALSSYEIVFTRTLILLGESLSFLQLVGAALILGGAAFGELFRQKQTMSPPEGARLAKGAGCNDNRRGRILSDAASLSFT